MRITEYFPGEIRKATQLSRKFVIAGWTPSLHHINKMIFIYTKHVDVIVHRKLDIQQMGVKIDKRYDIILILFVGEVMHPKYHVRPYLTNEIWQNIDVDFAKLNGISIQWLELAFAQ